MRSSRGRCVYSVRDVDGHFQRQHAGPKARDASNSLQQGRISCIEVAVAAAFDEGMPALRAGLQGMAVSASMWGLPLPCREMRHGDRVRCDLLRPHPRRTDRLCLRDATGRPQDLDLARHPRIQGPGHGDPADHDGTGRPARTTSTTTEAGSAAMHQLAFTAFSPEHRHHRQPAGIGFGRLCIPASHAGSPNSRIHELPHNWDLSPGCSRIGRILQNWLKP